ncbi:putative phospholipase B-like 2 [Galendromus occidentalis]|uniref:Phospholipase B-like n=1 Tax=Galendromus occidentalis TaxID=34638 RepID=A0AAJ6VXV5_9ACAR|nr:putative phospholipase B-like 2 [Galendromus occidentalis]
MFRLRNLVALSTLFGLCVSQKPVDVFLSAIRNGDDISLVPGKPPGALAWASYQNSITKEGWSYLEIRTNPSYEDEVTAYAAGALEGTLSRDLIRNHSKNMFGDYCVNNAEYCVKLRTYFTRQLKFMNERSLEERYRSPFWNQVYLILKQMAGIRDGYSQAMLNASGGYEDLDFLYFINNEGALFDLESVFGRVPDNNSISLISPCSLLVKIAEKDVIIGHSAWTSYRTMLRVQKKYMMPFEVYHGAGYRVPGHSISMSSYPGKLNSMDDFYVVSTGLAVSETTNNVFNKALFLDLGTETVPTGFRAMVANRLAKDGRHWTRTFEKHSSGTYNNQWVVLDYNKVELTAAGVTLANEAFWILEQLPTLIVAQDMTEVLQSQGYWASYNVPYFPAIYNESGYEAKFREHGDFYGHDSCPRAKIFRRDEFRVSDAASMMSLLRYNDYKEDPLSRCNCTPPYSPSYAIASRYDLFEKDGHYDHEGMKLGAAGAIDAKVADARSIRDFSFLAICGPTNDIQPTFSWSESVFSQRPLGHPDVFDFKPVRHKWTL